MELLTSQWYWFFSLLAVASLLDSDAYIYVRTNTSQHWPWFSASPPSIVYHEWHKCKCVGMCGVFICATKSQRTWNNGFVCASSYFFRFAAYTDLRRDGDAFPSSRTICIFYENRWVKFMMGNLWGKSQLFSNIGEHVSNDVQILWMDYQRWCSICFRFSNQNEGKCRKRKYLIRLEIVKYQGTTPISKNFKCTKRDCNENCKKINIKFWEVLQNETEIQQNSTKRNETK
jgi:hypothetical protein